MLQNSNASFINYKYQAELFLRFAFLQNNIDAADKTSTVVTRIIVHEGNSGTVEDGEGEDVSMEVVVGEEICVDEGVGVEEGSRMGVGVGVGTDVGPEVAVAPGLPLGVGVGVTI